jgi:DNA-binding transcriptional LysR family regulator
LGMGVSSAGLCAVGGHNGSTGPNHVCRAGEVCDHRFRSRGMHSCMDWRAIRFDWNRARAFMVAAEEGSFSAAGRALGIAQPTIGRQVAALEEELGVALFERIGNALELTTAGLDLMEHVRAMSDAATRVSLAATGQSLSVDGSVCITASELIAAYILPPILGRLRLAHPGIEIEIVASNTARDLRRREADIAIRNFTSTQPELVARKIADRSARLYASPAYLERIGNPTSTSDLSRADFFGFDRSEIMINGLRALGVEVTHKNFPIITDNHLVQWELTKQGVGIGIVMDQVGDAEPRVRRVLPNMPPLPVPIWLATHQEVRTSRRIRVVFDLLAEELSQPPKAPPQ